MKFKEILNIPGMSGLFKMVAQTKTAIIVESLTDGKRQPIATTHRVVMLNDVQIFTTGEEMPLIEVFKKMNADGQQPSIDSKADDKALRGYFKTLVPELDDEKVHTSHLKKILSWYQLLKGKIDFNAKDETEGDAEPLLVEGKEKPIVKVHESHAPKADQHAKTTSAKTRKKV